MGGDSPKIATGGSGRAELSFGGKRASLSKISKTGGLEGKIWSGQKNQRCASKIALKPRRVVAGLTAFKETGKGRGQAE